MPEGQWSEAEHWAWQEIRAGRLADFNARDDKELDPKALDEGHEGRKLRSDFLAEILFREPYRSAIPAEGVRIVGAWFPEPVELAHGRLERQLWLERCRFDGPANLSGLQIDGWLSLEGSAFSKQGSGATSFNLYRARISHVSLERVTVVGTLTMRDLEVAEHLMGEGATFQDVDLGGAKVGRRLDLGGATVAGTLTMNRLQVQNLVMGEGATFQDVDLWGAKVGGWLRLGGAAIAGTLTMNGLVVGENLFMCEGATFQDVDLEGAKVGGELNMSGATVAGTLTMRRLDVGRLLFMREGATFQVVDLEGAKVSGLLNMSRANVAGELTMEGLEVGDALVMGEGATFKDVRLQGAKISGALLISGARLAGAADMRYLRARSVYLRECYLREPLFLTAADLVSLIIIGADLAELDLRGAKIGYLRLAVLMPTQWRNNARLILRGASVVLLDDSWGFERHESSWPEHIDRVGFKYGELQGVLDTGGGYTGLDARPLDWLKTWLMRQEPDSPEPYSNLGTYLRNAGRPEKAEAILYEGRERARRAAKRERLWLLPLPGSRWWGLTLLKWTIGYGIGLKYFRALGWVLALTLVGALVLVQSGQGPAGEAAKAVYSLDQLLPIVEFEKYDKVALQGWVAYYFYAQKLAGWMLGSFLIAGLAGLTQK